MEIENKHYTIIDEWEPLSVQDCFVKPAHKVGVGHGEGKFYMADDNSKELLMSFFDDDFFKINPSVEYDCVVAKSDLWQYVNVMKPEFEKPKLPYIDIEKFKDTYKHVNSLVDNMGDFEHFKITKADVTHPGVYINSTIRGTSSPNPKDGYERMRHILIPIITSMQIYKLQSFDDQSILYYWRPFPDFEAMANPDRIIAFQYSEKKGISNEEKDKLVKLFLKRSIVKDKNRREGQSEYRKKLTEEFNKCPITGISESQLLIASHIKPWAVCSREKEDSNDSDNDFGMYDPKNGFLLSALYDKLFDRGFITISDEGKIIISSYLNPEDRETIKNDIDENKQYFNNEILKDRLKYLQYHHEFVFQGKYNEK